MRQAKALASSRLKDPRLENLDAAVEVRRHPGARRLTLRVSRTRRAVIVTLPVQCDLDEAGYFLHRNIDWVRERLDSLPDPVPFKDSAVMPLRGKPHRIVFTGRGSKKWSISVRNSNNVYSEIRVGGAVNHAPRRLKDWLCQAARSDLQERVDWHTKRLGIRAKKIAVRDQSSRWGSCSTTGVLSFSWRLIMAPPRILDYVAAHEVAHLLEMNHGPKFWAIVARAVPDLDEAKRWLQVYGMDLHRYGPLGRA
jgi:predicted metal-dependent hydrolase